MTSTILDRNGGTTSSSPSTSREVGLSSSAGVKAPVTTISQSNITLSGEQTIGGIAVVSGDRVLVAGQTDGTTNGIYTVSTGAWSRAPDFNRTDDVVRGTMVYVAQGSGLTGLWVLTTTDPVIDTSSLSFSSLNALISTALISTNNLSDLSSAIAGWDALAGYDNTLSPTPSAGVLDLSVMTKPIEHLGGGTISSVTMTAGTMRILGCNGTTTITASSTNRVLTATSGSFIFKAGTWLVVTKMMDGTVRWIPLNEDRTKGSTVTPSAGLITLGRDRFYHVAAGNISDIDWSDAVDGSWAWLYFDGSSTITHDATTLKLPSGASINAVAGDRALFMQDSGDNVICLDFIKANGTAIVGTAATSGQTLRSFFPRDNEPPSSNYATFSTRNGHPVLVFPDAVVYAAIFTGILPAAYGGGGLTVEIEWMCSTTSTNKVCFGGYIEYMDVGSTDYDSDSFSSEAIDTTGVAASGTSGVSSKTTLTFASGSAMDSLVADAAFRLKIARETGQANDTNAGDIQVLAVRVKET